jgi:ribosomal-protein-serine acetyltransferase
MEEIQLTDGFVTLRPHKLSDLDEIYSAVRESLPELLLWMPWCHADYSIEETRKFILERPKDWDQGISYDFAIVDSRNGAYLGGCGINRIDTANRFANLGYWVRSSQVKQGVATRAILLMSQFGFRELKLNRIEILIAIENKASQRVAEKSGAEREGVLRNRLLLQGKVHHAVLFSLIPRYLIP